MLDKSGKGYHKRRPQSGEVNLVRTFCRQDGKEFFRYGRPHFTEQKTLNFSKFMMRWKEKVEPVWTFS